MSELCSTDFFRKTKYNDETKTQIWMSMIADGHDNICDCPTPFAHLLSTIFPPGHQDRDNTINYILKRDYKLLWHSGGEEEERTGSGTYTGGGGFKNIKEEESTKEDIEDALMAAAAAAADEGPR